jgi:hypothetical protein
VALADVNADGHLDMVVSNGDFASKFAVLVGNGAGGFGTPTIYDGGVNPSSVSVADFNGDGKADVLISTSNTDEVRVYSGNGDGTLDAPVSFGLNGGDNPQATAVADLDGDTLPEVVTANLGGGAAGVKDLSVLLNTTSLRAKTGATLDAQVDSYLQLSGGSASFGRLRPTIDQALYYADASLSVLSTWPGVHILVHGPTCSERSETRTARSARSTSSTPTARSPRCTAAATSSRTSPGRSTRSTR